MSWFTLTCKFLAQVSPWSPNQDKNLEYTDNVDLHLHLWLTQSFKTSQSLISCCRVTITAPAPAPATAQHKVCYPTDRLVRIRQNWAVNRSEELVIKMCLTAALFMCLRSNLDRKLSCSFAPLLAKLGLANKLSKLLWEYFHLEPSWILFYLFVFIGYIGIFTCLLSLRCQTCT